MKSSLSKLQKILKLEAERGYDNHAVVGGLERMLERWEAEARSDGVSEELIQLTNSRIRDYKNLTTTSRAEVIEGILKRISRTEELDSNPSSAPSSAKPEKTNRPERNIPPRRPPVMAQSKAQPAQSTKKKADTPQEKVSEHDELETGVSVEADEFTEDAAPPSNKARPDLPPVEPAALSAPVTVLPGVGPKHALTLERLGLRTLRDMLYYLPRRYDDYSRLKSINRLWYGEEVTVIGTVQSINSRFIRSNRFQIVEAVVQDGTGALRLNWFNQAWIGKRLRPGTHIVISGKIDQYLGRLVMNNPDWEPLEQQQLSTNRIVPVYSLTANITQRWLRRMLNGVVEYWAPRIPDMLPPDLRRSAGIIPISQALLQTHFPDSWDDLKAARYRLAFDEIFLLQLGVLRQKKSWEERTARSFQVDRSWLETQVARLPFPLTGAQQRALDDISRDLASGKPMNRLLQGDVGSGKTVVAAFAAVIVMVENTQAAFMAPTSILAEQHFRNMQKLLASPFQPQPANEGEPGLDLDPPETEQPPVPALFQPDEIRLMIGATPEAEKQEIRAGLADGRIKMVIGTHALIEDPVQFADLQLAIIDEQHRFGVDQRAALRSKGTSPHLLVMTATPIPRSLALTVYGDLDLSVMDEMPPGRKAVDTFVIMPLERERVYNLIRSQVTAGRQAFIIYPLVEESENSEAKAAVEEHARLQAEVFPQLQAGLLHGRMKPEDKDQVMTHFRDGEYNILVSTSVVEVGVDIPNATVMVIEGANRFGLAQLHQFRGRVGRGSEKSYCILIPDTNDEAENERLKVMVETNDGFILAERDLEQRGPGSFLGTRQSGFSELQMAKLTDVLLIENVRRHVQVLMEQNPDLNGTEFAALNAAFERFWGRVKGDLS